MIPCLLAPTEVVRDLLSRDPVLFNSTINAHFASGCTYQGRGLKVAGASQIKHVALLHNIFDFGSAAKVADEDVHWDDAATTAIVKATRQVRPAFFPLFQFAVPTRVVLTFNAEEGSKDTLFCTQWKDEWPLEQTIQGIPVLGHLYRTLLVPLLSLAFLWTANVVFWLHSHFETAEHRYARNATKIYRQNVEPRLPPSLIKGFDTGVHAAEHIGQQGVVVASHALHGPLRIVEELARTGTVLVNLALPHQLQLPYPSIFVDSTDNESAKPLKIGSQSQHSDAKLAEKPERSKPAEATARSANVAGEGTQSPRKKVSGSPHVNSKEHEQASDAGDDAAKQAASKHNDESNSNEEPRHAKVVVGPSQDGSLPQAKEIDVVNQQVTEKAPTETAQQSLYDVLKRDNELPDASGNGKKSSSGKKKNKNGVRK